MSIFAKTVGVVLAALVGCGVVVGTAAAATPGAVSDPAPQATVRILVFEGRLAYLQSVRLPGFRCPHDHPWLQNRVFSPRVPPGVEVQTSGSFVEVRIGEGFQGDGIETDAQGLVIGWRHGEATNWSINNQSLQIWAHCTSDPNEAYKRSRHTPGSHGPQHPPTHGPPGRQSR